MNIVQYLESAKAQIKAQEEREGAIIKERVLNEIQPKFAEIEQIKAEELDLLTKNYNADRKYAAEQYDAQVVALQKNYDIKNEEIIQMAENKKADLLKSTVDAEVRKVVEDCRKAILELDNLIAKRSQKE